MRACVRACVCVCFLLPLKILAHMFAVLTSPRIVAYMAAAITVLQILAYKIMAAALPAWPEAEGRLRVNRILNHICLAEGKQSFKPYLFS